MLRRYKIEQPAIFRLRSLIPRMFVSESFKSYHEKEGSIVETFRQNEEMAKKIKQDLSLRAHINPSIFRVLNINNENIFYEKMSLETLYNIFSKHRGVEIKKEIQAHFLRSKLFRKMKQSHSTKLENDASLLIDYFFCSIFAEREDLDIPDIIQLIAKNTIGLKELAGGDDLLSTINDEFVWASNQLEIEYVKPQVFLSFVKGLTPYIPKMQLESIAGLTKLSKTVLKSNKEFLRFEEELMGNFIRHLEEFIINAILANKQLMISPLSVSIILDFIDLSVLVDAKSLAPQDLASRAADLIYDLIEERAQESFFPFHTMSNTELLKCIKLLSNSGKLRQHRSDCLIRKCLMNELALRNLETFGLQQMTELLLNLKIGNININHAVAQKIITNWVVFDVVRSPTYSYLLISVFQSSKIPLNQLNERLFSSFRQSLEGRELVKIPFQELKMLTSILQYFCENQLNRPKMYAIKKRVDELLSCIQYSVKKDPSCPILDVLTLSSIFTKYLSVPNFLFDVLIDRQKEIEINQANKFKIKNLVEVLLSRLNHSYTYHSFLGKDTEFNRKWTDNTLELMSIFLDKFRKSKYISYQMMAADIISHQALFEDVFPDKAARTTCLRHLIKQMSSYITVSKSKDYRQFFQILKATSLNIEDTKPGVSLNLLISILDMIEESLQKPQGINKLVPFFYYIILATKNAGIVFSDKRNVIAEINVRAKEIFVKYLIPPLVQKGGVAVYQITYEKSVQQYFNRNILSSELKDLEHLPEILIDLKIKVTEKMGPKLTSLFIKVCSTWKGRQFLKNILVLNQLQLIDPEIVYSTVENIFTLLEYESQEKHFRISEENKIEELLQFIEIFSFNINEYRKLYPEKMKKKVLISLSVLASGIVKNLSDSQLILLIEALGDSRANYSSLFIQEVKRRTIDGIGWSSESVIAYYTKFPYFLHNKDISLLFRSSVDLNKKPKQLIELSIKQRFFGKEIASIIFDSLESGSLSIHDVLPYLSTVLPETINIPRLDHLFRQIIELNESKLSRLQKEQILTIVSSLILKYSTIQMLKDHEIIDQLIQRLSSQILLHADYGYTQVEAVDDAGRSHTISYLKSLSLIANTQFYQLPKTNFMVYPFLDLGKGDEEKIDDSYSSYNKKHTGFSFKDHDNIFTLSPEQPDHELHEREGIIVLDIETEIDDLARITEAQEYYFSYLKRFCLYMIYQSYTPSLPVHNEVLSSNFQEAELKYNQNRRATDDFTEFLIDVTSGLQNLEYSFETSYKDPITRLSLDIYIEEKKIAVFFLDREESARHFRTGEEIPNQLMMLKERVLLLRSGIRCCFIDYDNMRTRHPSSDMQEDYLRTLLNKFN